MLQNTKAHLHKLNEGQPCLRTGPVVPSGAVNLAYYNSPRLSPFQNVSISDTSKLEIENLAQELNNEILMYPSANKMLRNSLTEKLPSNYFEVTDRFIEDKPLYYCYRLSRYFYGDKDSKDNGIRLVNTKNKKVYGDKYKYLIELVPTSFNEKVYEVYIYTSFLVEIKNKVVAVYNALDIKSSGTFEIFPDYKENISPQPFYERDVHYTAIPVVGEPVRSHSIYVKEYEEIDDTRDIALFTYKIVTSNGFESLPIQGYAVHSGNALKHEMYLFSGLGMRVSPEDRFYTSAKEIILNNKSGIFTENDLKNSVYKIIIISKNEIEIQATVNPDGDMLPVVEVLKETGLKLKLPEMYHISKRLDGRNFYVKMYAVKMKDHRQIMIRNPIDSNVLDNWYLRIQYGMFRKLETDSNGHNLELIYTVPEYINQEFSFTNKEPFKDIENERPVVVNNHLMKLKHSPIYVKTEDYRTPVNLKVVKKTLDDEVELVVKAWGAKDGLIEVSNVVGKNDNIFVNYSYEEECLEYRGYKHQLNGNDVKVTLDMNPNAYHSYDKPIKNSEGYVIGFEEFGCFNLFNQTVHIFVRPYIVNGPSYQIKNEEVVYHKFEDVKENEYDILIGKVYLRHNTTLENMKVIDTRSRGGGLIKEIEDDVRRTLEPESDYYFDIGYWDGTPYNENSVIILRIDNRILKENGGRFSKEDVQEAFDKWASYGSLPIVEYMTTFSEKNSPNNTMVVEKTHINRLDMRPEFITEKINTISTPDFSKGFFYNNHKPYGIINLVESDYSKNFILTTSRNRMPVGDLIYRTENMSSLGVPHFLTSNMIKIEEEGITEPFLMSAYGQRFEESPDAGIASVNTEPAPDSGTQESNNNPTTQEPKAEISHTGDDEIVVFAKPSEV